jgi:hypothetical protein
MKVMRKQGQKKLFLKIYLEMVIMPRLMGMQLQLRMENLVRQ